MMAVSTHTISASGNDENRSDLTNIRGIGASRKRWLNSIGIYTIADLSQASVDEVESSLKSGGRLLSRGELEEWIAQAKTVDLQNQPAESFCALPDPLLETEPLETEPASSSLVAASTDWIAVAVFKVEYQTRQIAGKVEQRTLIHHLETNATETWSGFETQLIQPWMLDRIEATLPQPEAENPVVPEIIQLQVIQSHQIEQPMIADHAHPLFPGAILASEPFALEASVQLTGLSDANLQKQIPYSIQCTVHDVSTGSTTILGTATLNISSTANITYKALLPELMLSHSGIYRLKVSVTLQNSQAADRPTASGYFKVPMLQVV
ncbi:MAG: hypothetical protein IGS50_17045 [Synechococcales cyanobacterium C42_A2020_086]|nr:hypothetical protein [Synechococcales cyanobacterium C42_A2020_086]